MSKPVGTKDTKRGIKKGLRPKNRKLAAPTQNKKLTANQWQNTPQQNMFMDLWLNPANADTFGNAYKSALQAKYSPYTAKIIAAPTTNNKWIREYLRGTNMDTEHVKQGIQDVYMNPATYNNAKSPADTRLKALELLARITGIIDNKHQTNVTLVQPILSGQSINERVVIDQ